MQNFERGADSASWEKAVKYPSPSFNKQWFQQLGLFGDQNSKKTFNHLHKNILSWSTDQKYSLRVRTDILRWCSKGSFLRKKTDVTLWKEAHKNANV